MYQVKIQLENDTLIIRGSPEESVGCVLRGKVVLVVKETVKVKSIQMNLSGKMKIQWNERYHPQPMKREHVIIEHHWTFLSAQKKYHLLLPNTYLYPFELALPGHLAESFDSHSFGSLSYKLKTIVERPAFVPNTVHRKEFYILRHSLPQEDNVMQITNEWRDRLAYTIKVPQRVYARGQIIKVEYDLSAPQDIHVRHMTCFLKEYMTHVITESRIVQFFRQDNSTSGTQSIRVPSSFGAVQADCDHALIKVQHKLKFNISMVNKQGQISEIRASMPIEIVTRSEDELPSYENAWQSLQYSPYDPSPLTPLDGAGLDYFALQPSQCSRLPSYHTFQDILPS